MGYYRCLHIILMKLWDNSINLLLKIFKLNFMLVNMLMTIYWIFISEYLIKLKVLIQFLKIPYLIMPTLFQVLNHPIFVWELLIILLQPLLEIMESINLIYNISYFPTILRIAGYFSQADIENASTKLSLFFTNM